MNTVTTPNGTRIAYTAATPTHSNLTPVHPGLAHLKTPGLPDTSPLASFPLSPAGAANLQFQQVRSLATLAARCNVQGGPAGTPSLSC